MSTVDVSVDFKDVWTAITDVADTISSETSSSLVNNGFVLPRGVSSPEQLAGWYSDPHRIEEGKYLSSYCSRAGICSDTSIRFGVFWYFGGRVNGQGRYIANADVYAVVDSIGLGQRFDIRTEFDNPITVGNGVAQLSGSIVVDLHFMRMHHATWRAQFEIRGDGAGRIYWL